MAADSNRLSIIKKHGQTCGKCGRLLGLGAVVTWSPGEASPYGSAWRCVEGDSACCPRDPSVIAAKRNGTPLPPSADVVVPGEKLDFTPSPGADTALMDDNVFPTSPALHGTDSTASAGGSDIVGMLAAAMAPRLQSMLQTKVDAKQVRSIVDDRVADLVESAIAQLEQRLRPVHRLEVRLPDGRIAHVDGAHPKLPEAIQLLQVCNAVYIYGPAGAGKTHAARQISDALNARFVPFQAGKLSTESLIRAFVDAHGKPQDTAFLDAYGSDDTLIFLDEFDRWPTHLQVLLNTALANGYLQARTGNVPRGKNYILAAGNTNMRGRDEYFPEAQASEFSTLDRFACLHWPYDTAHEDSIVESINPAPAAKSWVAWIRKIRPEAISGKRGKVLATPRAMYDGAKALRLTSLSVETLADAFVFKGIDKATRDYFVNTWPLPHVTESQRRLAA
jgi:hypothetical protein